MVNFGPGCFQWLVQAVPLTALVCAGTIALILLLVKINAQSLANQPRRIQEIYQVLPWLTRLQPLLLARFL